MSSLILWVLAVIYTEAVTEILVNSMFFNGFRGLLFEINNFLSELFSCGYCMSVWVSATVAWTLPIGVDNKFIGFVISTFVIHRLSNLFHEFTVRWLGRIPWTAQINQIQHVVVPGGEDG